MSKSLCKKTRSVYKNINLIKYFCKRIELYYRKNERSLIKDLYV